MLGGSQEEINEGMLEGILGKNLEIIPEHILEKLIPEGIPKKNSKNLERTPDVISGLIHGRIQKGSRNTSQMQSLSVKESMDKFQTKF